MTKLNTAPGKLKILLMICIVGVIVSIGVTFLVYSYTRSVSQSVGKDTVPSIVASQHIKATLSDAHANAMNAMAINEKLGGKFWSLYRKDMNELHSELIDASKSITYGDEERQPLLTISSNISAYEYTVGGAVAGDSQVSADQFMEANRLMQQKILPASSALDKVNSTHLNEIYDQYVKKIHILSIVMYTIGFSFLIILLYTQLYLFKKSKRILNFGLLMATVLFAISMIYSSGALNSVKSDLYRAKHDAFDSIDALWSARAVAHNSKAVESLYLLHHETGIVQTADTINFNLSSSKLCSDPKEALKGGKFEGYLKDELSNITFPGEEEAANAALQEWIKYMDIDKQIRNLEYDSKHDEAIALSIGDSKEQSNYEFTKFDAALGKTIDINQKNFDSSIDSMFKTLNIFPFVTAAFLILIIGACILGLKARMDEYKI